MDYVGISMSRSSNHNKANGTKNVKEKEISFSDLFKQWAAMNSKRMINWSISVSIQMDQNWILFKQFFLKDYKLIILLEITIKLSECSVFAFDIWLWLFSFLNINTIFWVQMCVCVCFRCSTIVRGTLSIDDFDVGLTQNKRTCKATADSCYLIPIYGTILRLDWGYRSHWMALNDCAMSFAVAVNFVSAVN